MTNPKHTDTSRSGDLVAPMPLGIGTFVPPSAVVFFDGDSVIRINRNGTLELGPKWADAGDAAAAFFNELVSRVVPSWNARIEADGKHIAELDGRAMEYLLLSDKQALRIAKLEAALTLCANHVDWIPHPHCVEVEAAIRAALGEKQ